MSWWMSSGESDPSTSRRDSQAKYVAPPGMTVFFSRVFGAAGAQTPAERLKLDCFAQNDE